MPKDLQPGMNTGVQIVAPRPDAWMLGGETGIAQVILEADAQYDVYLPEEESQLSVEPTLDSSDCVTFSALNNLETLGNRLRVKGLPATHEKFLKDEGYVNPQSNKLNFSDRFTAKMSGTSHAGNTLAAVGDAIRRRSDGTGIGLLPEKDWPRPSFADLPGNDQAAYDERWNRYYAEIPQNLKDKAKRFLDYFDVSYQWVAVGSSTPAQLREALKYGPLQIAAQVCSPWSSTDGMPPIPACGCTPGHATLLYGFKPDAGTIPFKDFDHYKSYRKLLSENYCLPYAVQYALTPRALSTTFKYTFLVNLKFGAPASAEVKAMQTALQTLKRTNGQPYMTPGVFGPFGPQTKVALGLFQTDKGIPDPDGQGTNFGPATRAAMNKALNT